MAKVLLVDTNFSSQPIYNALQAYGHEVHVVGGNPSDCLARVAKKYWPINYAEVNLLKQLIESERYDFIVPGCTDRSYSSCAEVGSGLFPGLENSSIDQELNNKANFRALAHKLKISVPLKQEEKWEELRWPLIVKPVDSFSGKGITVLRYPDREKFLRATEIAKNASASGYYLIEDFVEGVLHSHSAFLYDGKIVRDFVVEEQCSVNPFVVDTSRLLQYPNPKILNGLRNSVESIARELDLKNGLFHVQFIQNNDNFWLIEVTRRCPGDLYSQLIEMSTGYNYVDAYVRAFLNLPPIIEKYVSTRNYVMRHTITVPTEQSYSYIHYKQSVLIDRWVSLSLVGDKLLPSPLSRIGILFASANSETELDNLFQITLNHQLYDVIS